MKFSQTLIIATLLVGLSSCSIFRKKADMHDTSNTTKTIEITGKKWQLIELNGKAIAEKINGRIPYLQLDDKNYLANAGCNTMGGAVSITGKNKIKFSQGMSTMMACPDLDIEHSLSKALIAADGYIIKEGILNLNKGASTSLAKFKLMPEATTANALSGTWELDYISGPRIAFNGLYPNSKPTITFDLASNKVSGNGSCNTYNTNFKTDDHKINFGPIMSTKMGCGGSGEQVYFSTLEKINTYSVDGQTLTFIMGDIAMMRFHKK
ncbi:META domain-containing protein [Sphingobacterium sp. SRCM116780]|uniref:META domain-containing protein n=1 Tax=Sphingobacterium sp. SRCM116780 TaxID=2907623 RepID=UPI001F301B41|nr:META domain-containing protein [Sphingobacterium sp. SRCM116780]UIR54951.1 META domain-containing protein [Sphingobacterium sp. SRCM116780]